MILDNETQKQLILNALLNVPIQGDFEGICKMMPQFSQVIEAVKTATIQEVQDAGKQPE